MKEQFVGAVDVQVHLNDSEAAKGYNPRGSTTVLVKGEWVPLEIATSREKMASYLAGLVG